MLQGANCLYKEETAGAFDQMLKIKSIMVGNSNFFLSSG